MLLQVQGIVAQYERAQIMERSRRGKLHAARRGCVSVLTQPPYGYRYIPKYHGGGDAALNIVPAEQWIRFSVPAIVDADLFHAVAEQLEHNRQRCRPHRRRIHSPARQRRGAITGQ
jgi:hypothetical protein